jgi:hypothetical protein
MTMSSARPWNPAVTPYLYGTLFGSPYTATLSQNITTTPAARTQETYTFSDAQAAPTAASGPVIAGLTIQMPSGEKCRVISVSGTSVTIERGSMGTTPATQTAGTVQVLNRLGPLSTSTWGTYPFGEVVFASPHNLDAGNVMTPTGTWPSFYFASGDNFTFSPDYPIQVFPTSATTALFAWMNLTHTTNNNIVTTYDLSGRGGTISYPELSGMPHDFIANMAGQLAGCNYHLSVPMALNPDGLWALAEQVKAAFPAGREVWLEVADEP